jgi:iron complex outermembrane receptor protein
VTAGTAQYVDLFGSFNSETVKQNYFNALPSVNLKFDLSKDLIVRLSAASTMTRPDYYAIGASPLASLNDLTLTGSGGNPYLKPLTSENFDASIEWYFAPRGLFSLALFEMDLTSYVGYGTTAVPNQLNGTLTQQGATHGTPGNVYSTYNVTAPVNVTGNVVGFEVGYQLPIGKEFGIDSNLTYSRGQETDNNCEVQLSPITSSSPCDLIGDSRITGNISGYYESDHFNARLSYNYRSSYYTGKNYFGSPEYEDQIGTVAASLGYTINDHFAVHLDLLNLNDPIAKYYAFNKDQPLAIYDNGRQYYLSFNAKF